MSDQATQQISCRIITKPALSFIEARLPLDLIDHVNAYIDGIREHANDYAGELVGQIKQNPRSAQLKLNLSDQAPLSLAQVITQVGQQYVDTFGLSAEVIANDMWTIHSYAGDYNPMHDHGANTFVGLSSIVYLKVPEAISNKDNVEGGGTPNLMHASGACDGFTQFIWGTHGVTDSSLLRPPTQQFIKPEVGKLMVFPNWLLHSVQPFFGEGERRSLSCNMDIVIAPPES
ncbi:MAG: putative 2OG-Fe(II) oxygenase [Proteobacteria bacterium]|nr:putative 2OG-Fe(II) oxygenase [Pseudomonadota bacterium]